MVQSEACAYKANAYSAAGSPSRSELSKRAGFENMKKQEQIRKISSAQAAKVVNNFGPMFRDREHFVSLHHC